MLSFNLKIQARRGTEIPSANPKNTLESTITTAEVCQGNRKKRFKNIVMSATCDMVWIPNRTGIVRILNENIEVSRERLTIKSQALK